MKTFSDRLAFALETELYNLTQKNLTECEKIKLAIALCKKALSILRKYLLNYFFGSLEEEITFFKQINQFSIASTFITSVSTIIISNFLQVVMKL